MPGRHKGNTETFGRHWQDIGGVDTGQTLGNRRLWGDIAGVGIRETLGRVRGNIEEQLGVVKVTILDRGH